MIINKSIDIENEVREALSDYLTAYCRPLPEEYDLPNILITLVGGTDSQTIDTFEVVLDSRAQTEADALDYLNTATGILKQVAKEQTSALRHVVVNSSGSWGADPVRPDLSMCSARLAIVAHQEITEVDNNV
ncbi:MAG: hypothetical protein J5825_06015 [Lachnospiraceae bacterium]|nr:hypothetical protein [Lachnospiraceae bacterium]